jgi:hypothetical protein
VVRLHILGYRPLLCTVDSQASGNEEYIGDDDISGGFATMLSSQILKLCTLPLSISRLRWIANKTARLY